ncbi:hypothetical protein RhiirA4_396116 [Rhizophagus irregularis]|uniref:TLDc domain-containing protein n=1 Tax=Rhizophagus irregularis TaxID=588596 RepID=A0A2I1G4G7_9GLOM|nr:hypothetical protein RhiirA4_396116 [Rhizophagus irregularis]
MNIGRVNSGYYNNALYEHSSYGFNFGSGTLRMDSNQTICVCSSSYYDNGNNILSPYNGTNFVPEEIEVFKITTS